MQSGLSSDSRTGSSTPSDHKTLIQSDVKPANILLKFGNDGKGKQAVQEAKQIVEAARFADWDCRVVTEANNKAHGTCATAPYQSPHNYGEIDDTFATAIVFAQMYVAGVSAGAGNHEFHDIDSGFSNSGDADMIHDFNTLILSYAAHNNGNPYLAFIVDRLERILKSPFLVSPISYTIGNLSHSILKMWTLSCVDDMEDVRKRTASGTKYLNFAQVLENSKLADGRISFADSDSDLELFTFADAEEKKSYFAALLSLKTECKSLWSTAHMSLKALLEFESDGTNANANTDTKDYTRTEANKNSNTQSAKNIFHLGPLEMSSLLFPFCIVRPEEEVRGDPRRQTTQARSC